MPMMSERRAMLPQIIISSTTPAGEKNIELFSRMYKDRIVFCFSEINDELAASIIAQLLALDSQSHEDIHLYINSPGGSVTSGLAIIDTMNLVSSDINTCAFGMCASMGAVVLAAGAKGKREALEHARILIHQVLGQTSGQATDIEIAAAEIKKTKDELNRLLAEYTGQPLEVIAKDTERDHHFDAQSAMEYGLIDKVLK